MYWWEKAAEIVQQGRAEAFGFITTNSITQTFNRRLIQRHLDAQPPLSLTFAIPDHPWVDNGQGAAVRIAMSVARAGTLTGKLATLTREVAMDEDDAHEVDLTETDGIINADFTVGADVAGAVTLKANTGITSNGMMLAGAGFIVTEEEARQLGLGSKPELDARIRPYRNGKDLTARPRGVFLIDLFGLKESEVISQFPELYQHVFTKVKPERDQSRDKGFRERWFVFGRTREDLRNALKELPRFIATPETAKHRVFQFLETEILPDHKLVCLAFHDAYILGLVSSNIHITWSLATGSWLGVGNDSVYASSRCFQTFPFPDATPDQQARIRELAEQLDAHRKRQQAQHATLTLTDLYNVVEKLKAGEPLTAKDQIINQQGLASVVLSLHQQLDAAVADAYGWPEGRTPNNLPASEVLTRLVRLNHERAAEEQTGTIRYLRPAYQRSGVSAQEPVQLGLDLPTTGLPISADTPTPAATGQREWPKELAQQMQAVRDVVQQATTPITAAQVAARFGRLRPTTVQPLLDTLTMLALLRQAETGYVN